MVGPGGVPLPAYSSQLLSLARHVDVSPIPGLRVEAQGAGMGRLAPVCEREREREGVTIRYYYG